MKQEKYETLIRKLEKEAKKNFGLYQAKVVVFAGLGYAYIWFFLLLFIPLTAWTASNLLTGHFIYVKIKILLILGSLSFLILRALIFRNELPDGIVLEREHAPALFETLDELKERMKAPEIHTVIMDEQFNASVAQYSRFGLFGNKQNVLVVGFPLLLSLSPEQMKSVLAHELGHVSKADPSIGAWIYRVNQTWVRLVDSLEKGRGSKLGRMIFKRFFDWYYPLFAAWSFVMRRRQEYVADSFAAGMTSPQVAGEALIQVHVKGYWYAKKFMNEEVVKKVWESGSVPRLFSVYREKVRELSGEEQEEILKAGVERETDLSDTHPCLRDRLAALGVEPASPRPVERTAAEAYLANWDAWLKGFDEVWNELYGEDLREAVETSKMEAEEFRELLQKENKTARDYMRLAQLSLERDGTDAALDVLREMSGRFPGSAELGLVHALVGGEMWKAGRDECVELFEKMVRLNWQLREDGLRFLRARYVNLGKIREVYRVSNELAEWRKYLRKTDAEIKRYKDPRLWMKHDLPDDIVGQMAEEIIERETVAAVYAAGLKLSPATPQRKHYVVGVLHDLDPDERAFRQYTEEFDEWAENVWLPHLPVSLVHLAGDDKLLSAFEGIEGSLIFLRSGLEEEKEIEKARA